MAAPVRDIEPVPGRPEDPPSRVGIQHCRFAYHEVELLGRSYGPGGIMARGLRSVVESSGAVTLVLAGRQGWGVMGEFSPWHLLIVAVVFMALFGYKKMPDAARSIGRSMRIMKTELAEMREDGAPTSHVMTPAPVAPPASGPVGTAAHSVSMTGEVPTPPAPSARPQQPPQA